MCGGASKVWLLAVWFGILPGSGQSDTSSFRPPQPYELEQLYTQIKQRCPSNVLACFRTELQSITAQHGPRAAIEAFTLLKDRGDIDPTVDGHHIAHHIGHETAMVFGPTAKAFALCPASYNYGCMHGFFQHALGTGEIADKDAAKICDDLAQDPILSLKAKLSCYHGLGHGVMIHVDYELPKALNTCDVLSGPFAQQGCWQGVFMENMDAAQEGRWQKGHFSLDDPLAPCDRLDEKYQYECFINQSAWLMQFYHNDVAKAAEACLKAPRPSITPCLETIGLLTTNSEWQPQLLQKAGSKTFLENAWTICTRFPRGYTDYCMVAALDNLMNSNTVDIGRAREFCHIVSKAYRAECRSRLDGNLQYLIPRAKRKRPRRRTATQEGGRASTGSP
jgi:hypothetical protein